MTIGAQMETELPDEILFLAGRYVIGWITVDNVVQLIAITI